MKNKTILILLILLIFSGCVGTGSKGIFGTGVSIALDPRSIGTQIDDSVMQKNLSARLIIRNKNYFIVFPDWGIFKTIIICQSYRVLF